MKMGEEKGMSVGMSLPRHPHPFCVINKPTVQKFQQLGHPRTLQTY